MGTVCYTGGGSGTDLSMVTATASDVFPGKVFVDKDGNKITGTGTSDATATTGYIYSGKTAYVNGKKITGSMTVGSILNFSAAVYSGRQVLLKWQNPYAATGKPFGGVFVNYSTNPYPEIDGTMIYTGYGNNTASGGWSQTIIEMPAENTSYYFSCTAYVDCNIEKLYGNTLKDSCTTVSQKTLTLTSSTTYTVPSGYTSADIFCVGGGGGGAYGGEIPGSGGGGGYTATATNVSITSGQILKCTVGAGGTTGSYSSKAGNVGGTTSVISNNVTLCAATGGNGGALNCIGGNGGSGGGAGNQYDSRSIAGAGGTNGGNGGTCDGISGGSGQGSTTRPFGETSGTVYSGGGGGAGNESMTDTYGKGGITGGGNGGCIYWDSTDFSETLVKATSGTANTGGGGGGGSYDYMDYDGNDDAKGGTGGSGIIIIRFK